MDVRDLPAAISLLPLFEGLSREEVAEFLTRCHKQVVSAGQSLMKAGEPADSCYLILRGRVEIRIKQGKGPGAVLATLEDGQMVGEMGLFRDRPTRVADVYVVKDTQVVQIQYYYLKRLEGVHPAIATRISHNLREVASQRVATIAAMAVAGGPVQAEVSVAVPEGREAMRTHLESSMHRTVQAAARGAAVRPAPAEAPPLVPIQIKMALARCPIFDGFSQDDLDRLIDRVKARRFGPSDLVVAAGDVADALWVVALGRLVVMVEHDGELQPVAFLGPGQCFGEMPLAQGTSTRIASVYAETTVTMLRLEYEDLRRAVAWRPETKERFDTNLARLVEQRT